jgi:hypothetical protein
MCARLCMICDGYLFGLGIVMDVSLIHPILHPLPKLAVSDEVGDFSALLLTGELDGFHQVTRHHARHFVQHCATRKRRLSASPFSGHFYKAQPKR